MTEKKFNLEPTFNCCSCRVFTYNKNISMFEIDKSTNKHSKNCSTLSPKSYCWNKFKIKNTLDNQKICCYNILMLLFCRKILLAIKFFFGSQLLTSVAIFIKSMFPPDMNPVSIKVGTFDFLSPLPLISVSP